MQMTEQNSSPSPSTISATSYAREWCKTIMKENDACDSGVDYASKLIETGAKPSEIVNKCTNWGVGDLNPSLPEDAATEGFRYGCYLTTALSGNKNNLCSVELKTDSNNNNNLSMPFVCVKNSCNNIFSANSDKDICQRAAQNTFDTMIDGRDECLLNESMSCIYELGTSDNMSAQEKQSKIPNVIGCTIGKLQSQMLYYAQKYQKENGVKPLSCLSYTSDGGKNKLSPSTPTDMFPEGQTYSNNFNNSPRRHK